MQYMTEYGKVWHDITLVCRVRNEIVEYGKICRTTEWYESKWHNIVWQDMSLAILLMYQWPGRVGVAEPTIESHTKCVR